MTIWRRAYIETDRMFRKGSFLFAKAAPGASAIAVQSTDAFLGASASRPLPVIIMNTPRPPTYALVNGSPTWTLNVHDQYYERRSVIGIRKGKPPALLLDAPLTKTYTPYAMPSGGVGGAAVGVYSTDADLFPLDTSRALPVFREAYVEYQVLTAEKNRLPFIPFMPDCGSTGATGPHLAYCGEVLGLSLNDITPIANNPNSAPNHHHLVSLSVGPYSWGGATLFGQGHIFTFSGIFSTNIYDAINTPGEPVYGVDAATVMRRLVVHELAHLFDVNRPMSVTKGHCTAPGNPALPALAWYGATCISADGSFHTTADWASDRFGFHVSPFAASEYLTIRRTQDPLWQTPQPQ